MVIGTHIVFSYLPLSSGCFHSPLAQLNSREGDGKRERERERETHIVFQWCGCGWPGNLAYGFSPDGRPQKRETWRVHAAPRPSEMLRSIISIHFVSVVAMFFHVFSISFVVIVFPCFSNVFPMFFQFLIKNRWFSHVLTRSFFVPVGVCHFCHCFHLGHLVLHPLLSPGTSESPLGSRSG